MHISTRVLQKREAPRHPEIWVQQIKFVKFGGAVSMTPLHCEVRNDSARDYEVQTLCKHQYYVHQ